MQYKTIVLELIQQRPEWHEALRGTRTLLATMERYAQMLKESHMRWQETLTHARPGSHPNQIASEALELALQEITDSLPHEPPPIETNAPSPESPPSDLPHPTSRD